MRFVLLLVAAVIAIFAAVAVLQVFGGPKPETANTAAAMPTLNVQTVDVMVARQPIPAGTQVTAAMIDKQPWPENLVLEGFIKGNDAEKLAIGKVTRSAFQAREPLIGTKLADTSESGFLAATLPAGMRAITIATDAITGVAGFVYPGDRIDLLFTHSIPERGSKSGGSGINLSGLAGLPGLSGLSNLTGASEGASYAEALATNIPVLAVNIRTASPENATASPESLISGVLGTTTPSSMTLQVTDIQAEKIRLAERSGNLSVALRSLKDRDVTATPPPANLASLTQVPLSSSMKQEPQSSEEVKVIRGVTTATSGASLPNFGLFTPPVAPR